VPTIETFAKMVFLRYRRYWKPGTQRVNRYYLTGKILPGFGGMRVDDVTSQDVEIWFASLRDTPGAANRALPVLSVLMTHAEEEGFRPQGSNPCLGIRRYHTRKKGRFLSVEDMHRLARTLCEHQHRHPRKTAALRQDRSLGEAFRCCLNLPVVQE